MKTISVIMPSYNQGQYIERAIVSVLNQDYPCTELIILDAASSDNTLDIIKKYESKITYWRSHKDGGQSAAINEGFQRASGEILTWLNSDDILLPGTLYAVNATFERDSALRWVTGNTIWIDKDDKILKTGKLPDWSDFFNRKHCFAIGGPTSFMHVELLKKHGYIREDFHYMMDTELWNRFIAAGERFKRLPMYTWALRLHEAAKMSGHNFKSSELSQSNHPSWIQKHKEICILQNLYPKFCENKFLKLIYTIRKICSFNCIRRLFELKSIGKNYKAVPFIKI